FDFLDILEAAYDVPRGCYLSWIDPEDKTKDRQERYLYQKANGRFHKSDRQYDALLSPRENRDKAFSSGDDDGQHDILQFVADIDDGSAALKEYTRSISERAQSTVPSAGAAPTGTPESSQGQQANGDGNAAVGASSLAVAPSGDAAAQHAAA